MLLFGGNDPFVSMASAFEFLDDKRTNMRVVTIENKLGHMPQARRSASSRSCRSPAPTSTWLRNDS